MRRNARTLAAGAAALVCSMLATSGASASALPQGQSNAKVTITWWTWTTNPNKVIANFEKAYPDITVQRPSDVGSGNLLTKLVTSLEAGTGPCVTQMPYYDMPEFLATKSFTNVARYVSSYKSDFPSWVWDQVSQNGAVYGLPEDIGPAGLMYQPAILSKYHIPVPTTWSQFASAAVALHKADPNMYLTFFAPNDVDNQIEGLWWQAGAHPFTLEPNGTWKVDLTGPLEQKVVNFWGSLVNEGAVAVDDDYTADWAHHVVEGRYAAMLGAAWSPTYEVDAYLPTNSTQEWTIGLLPQWVAGADVSTNMGGSANAITKDCPTKDLAAASRFMAYINTSKSGLEIDEQPATVSGGGRGLYPAASARGTVPTFNAPIPHFLGDPNAEFSKIAATVPENWEWSPWDIELVQYMSTQLAAASAGKESFSKALAITQSQLVSYARSEGYSIQVG